MGPVPEVAEVVILRAYERADQAKEGRPIHPARRSLHGVTGRGSIPPSPCRLRFPDTRRFPVLAREFTADYQSRTVTSAHLRAIPVTHDTPGAAACATTITETATRRRDEQTRAVRDGSRRRAYVGERDLRERCGAPAERRPGDEDGARHAAHRLPRLRVPARRSPLAGYGRSRSRTPTTGRPSRPAPRATPSTSASSTSAAPTWAAQGFRGWSGGARRCSSSAPTRRRPATCRARCARAPGTSRSGPYTVAPQGLSYEVTITLTYGEPGAAPSPPYPP